LPRLEFLVLLLIVTFLQSFIITKFYNRWIWIILEDHSTSCSRLLQFIKGIFY
jgi:hypothetical protein